MFRWWVSSLQLLELFVSSLVHLLFGFYIFSTAVAGDLSQTINDLFFKPNLASGLQNDEVEKQKSITSVDDLPPIVLVHGIFGFGKGVCMLLIGVSIFLKVFVKFFKIESL